MPSSTDTDDLMLALNEGSVTPAKPAEAPLDTLSRLYLGRRRADAAGSVVPSSTVDLFVHETLAAAFPKGWTLTWADGGWQDCRGRTITEPSVVVDILHNHSATPDVIDLAEAWKAFAEQEAVMVVSQPVNVSLV